MKSLIAGLSIFVKHDPEGTIGAEHDKFYGPYVPEEDLTKEELKILEDNGWFWDDEIPCWAKFV